jgi:predicted amidohydrolase
MLRISLIQATLVWENVEANLQNFTTLLQPLSGQTDLVILPEMFTTGFTMQAETHAEATESRTLAWMRKQASQVNAAITGSIIVREGASYFNRLLWVYPDGSYVTYDKRHLFSYSGEHEHFSAGAKRTLIEWKGFLICPFICYDLRFPVWSRNTDSYDLAIDVANWPSARIDAWHTLLKARAIENQCFVAGVNVVGQDGNGLEYPGISSVFDFNGTELLHCGQQAGVFNTMIYREPMEKFRSRFQFLKDRDRFEVVH